MSPRLNLRIAIATVGRQRTGPEKDLFDAYAKRLPWPIRLIEIKEYSGVTVAERRRYETERLLSAAPDKSKLIALDEKGQTFTSKDLSRHIAQWRDDGVRDLAFIIGGADGLDKGMTESADIILSLGSMTWPHLLVKVLLAEQLYRAHTIITGHPYHRE